MVNRILIIEAINGIDDIDEMKSFMQELNDDIQWQWQRYTNARDFLDIADPSRWQSHSLALARKEEADANTDMLMYSEMYERAYWELQWMRESCKC